MPIDRFMAEQVGQLIMVMALKHLIDLFVNAILLVIAAKTKFQHNVFSSM